MSEYLPWYRKRPDEIMDWIDLGTWINGKRRISEVLYQKGAIGLRPIFQLVKEEPANLSQ